MEEKIVIRGAREHNLKNINVSLPRNKLVVISGLSGSGKSSLAFDTLFAEGQRRYMESLSAYARQFLGRMDKPDVDLIEGLSPAISIEQKSTNKNPRSTVGTITEIYDYYRLLFARIGRSHCPVCGKEIKEQSVDQIIDAVLQWPDDTKIQILAPVIKGKKGEHQKILDDARKSGFIRARIDGVVASLEDSIKLDKQKKHTIEIIVDRIIISREERSRIADGIEIALKAANGIVVVLKVVGDKEEEVFFSQKNACPECGISIPELQPRLFSFNNPFGACPECTGLGIKSEYDMKLIIPDESVSYEDSGIKPYTPTSKWNSTRLGALAQSYGWSLKDPINTLTKEQKDALLNGSDRMLHFEYTGMNGRHAFYDQVWPGIIPDLKRRYVEAWGDNAKESLEKFMTQSVCSSCGGQRLRKEALGVTVGGKNIWQLCEMSVSESVDFFEHLTFTISESKIAAQVLKEIKSRLNFLVNVGLDYLTLERPAETLSGGEAQRIRLATQIGSALCGVMYILDEPSIGLDQKDNQKLINTLLQLRDNQNTVIVVEHDEDTLRAADYIIDMGKGAGVHGGSVIACGTPSEVMKNNESITGQYLAGIIKMEIPSVRRKGNGKILSIVNASEHNLRNISVDIPLGTFTCITGVSGSGKSTLMSDVLYPYVSNKVMRTKYSCGKCEKILGIEEIDKVINIDQSPIGRTPRSNPVTYVGVFDSIRDLFSTLPEAKARGYQKGRFSFNVKGGRCENCQGAGENVIEMNFLPDVYVQCEVCQGKRFNKETLEVMYKGKNINDVLNMTIDEACDFFVSIPHISRKLESLKSVGLGYIQLGQNALTLSGGEAQRVKLANELARVSTGRTLYIMDEPTTGLHFADVKQLMSVIQRLVDQGNSVLMIEHNLDVICQADYIIDLGPDGGFRGGTIVAQGLPEDVAEVNGSYTGQFIKEKLKL
ncbi:MAG: excinuclease ABC subunit UvrA [Treponema sp.]|nr:excinuclease ABC subunit UvrA [Treponema sp.]